MRAYTTAKHIKEGEERKTRAKTYTKVYQLFDDPMPERLNQSTIRQCHHQPWACLLQVDCPQHIGHGWSEGHSVWMIGTPLGSLPAETARKTRHIAGTGYMMMTDKRQHTHTKHGNKPTANTSLLSHQNIIANHQLLQPVHKSTTRIIGTWG